MFPITLKCGTRNAERGTAGSASSNECQSNRRAFPSTTRNRSVPRSEFRRQSAILFDRDDPMHARGEDGSKGSRPRPDLEHDVPGRRVEGVDDLAEDVGVAEEVLTEPLVRTRAHTLRMTTVRSSVADAPPVKPARSA